MTVVWWSSEEIGELPPCHNPRGKPHCRLFGAAHRCRSASCHQAVMPEPGTLPHSATNLFLPTAGQRPSCSYQGDHKEVTGWTSVPEAIPAGRDFRLPEAALLFAPREGAPSMTDTNISDSALSPHRYSINTRLEVGWDKEVCWSTKRQ